MMIRPYWMAMLLAVAGFLPLATAQAQTGTPVIRSFTVDQVPQLQPGTELVFHASGTPAGALHLEIDGVSSQLGLVETRPGTYEGAYTISIRDKIAFDSKVKATLTVGTRKSTTLLAQTLLTDSAFAAASAAAHPVVQISRFETRNTGAFTGGHELGFTLTGTPGGTATVSLDGGKTWIALTEQPAGQYTGAYTVKTRDRFTASTPVSATLAMAGKTSSLGKPLAPGVVTAPAPAAAVAAAAVAPCDGCGVVQAVNKVKVKGKPNYLGAIAGGVAGAALGNQVGKGDGNTAATVLGAVGGAVAGREIEKRVRSGTRYDVVVKLDSGGSKTVSFESEPAFHVGSKVRVSGETLVTRD